LGERLPFELRLGAALQIQRERNLQRNDDGEQDVREGQD
jgi:hypothetical protein